MIDLNIYRNKTVLVTGHTGFKGSWLTLMLQQVGAKVVGYALPPESIPNHFELLNLDIVSHTENILDLQSLENALREHRPEIVFHLAAQPLVRRSYLKPIETFETNVMGTVNLLEACRKTDSVQAILVITSDKCYENREWIWGYREIDPMGGHDPYSASKGAAELVVSSYRRSFFPPEHYGKMHNVLLASCRAGNVIGGGDWSEDRLLPDIVRATERDETVNIRSPRAIRPWQHVLDVLGGYLLLGTRLLEGNTLYADAWNFGPNDEVLSVKEVCELTHYHWSETRFNFSEEQSNRHEATQLKLDCSKAHGILGWRNRWDTPKSIEKTVIWYRTFSQTGRLLSHDQIEEWMNDEEKSQ